MSLLVANRDSHTISIIDIQAREVTEEFPTSGRPMDIEVLGQKLLVIEQQPAKLILYDHLEGHWSAAQQLLLPPSPVRLVVSNDGQHVYVSCRWAQTVLAFARKPNGVLHEAARVQLPFSPHEMRLLPNRQLLVASSFGAKLAILDPTNLSVLHSTDLRGHNIRGLAVHQDELYLTMQELSPLAHTTQDDIHWGNLVSNLLVHFPLKSLQSDALDSVRVDTQLGLPGHGNGDPGPLTILPDGRLLVAFSGTGTLGLVQPDNEIKATIDAGKHPVDLVAQEQTIACLNQHEDSVSIMRLQVDGELSRPIKIPLSISSTPSLAQRGEQLFYDSQLSHEGWMSCHSCHTDGHSNGQRNDNLSDGGFGSAKQVISLLGVQRTPPWSWLGTVESLEEQIKNSVELTMRGPAISDEDVSALVAYLQQLKVPAPPAKAVSAEVGEQLFRELECTACHQPPTYTGTGTFDVGFHDDQRNQKFNPPSLLGLRHRNAYLHDGRYTELSDLFTKAKHQLLRALTPAELDALQQFLLSL